jgi:hypothetical protein
MTQRHSFALAALACATGLLPAALTGQAQSIEHQIAEAVTPLPEAQRDGATVYGYRDDAHVAVVIREGTNDFVCLADTPGDETFQVSCYHKSLDPFMAMGRQLRAEGLSAGQVMERRKAAMEAGTLAIPMNAMMTTLRGTIPEGAMHPDTVSVLSVLYVPYATAESTGLPIRPMGVGQPWLMQPGLHRAHIMIGAPPRPFEMTMQHH